MKTQRNSFIKWVVAVLTATTMGGQVSSGAHTAQTAESPYDGFVLVRGGTFLMGDQFGDGPWAMKESPAREVELGDFLLAKHEVTLAEFGRFVEATKYKSVAEVDGPAIAKEIAKRKPNYKDPGRYSYWKEPGFKQESNHPVVMVAWEDAIIYCNWLSRQKGLPPAYDPNTGGLLDSKGQPTTQIRLVKGFRLPTEAEWEFAARERGRKVRFGNGKDIARSDEMNFDAAGTGQTVPSLRLPKDNLYPYNEKGIDRDATTPVGSFAPNALGLYDMSGNAWEWCCDTGGGDYPTDRRVNPCSQAGKSHVVRGGTHDTDAKACRVSARIDWYPRAFCTGSGFRVALTVDEPEGIVYIEGGSFLMGDQFGDGHKWLPETPVHEVEVGSFYIGRYEVTAGQFRQFATNTGYVTSAEKREGAYSQTPEETHWKLLPFKQTDDEPVLQMSWNDAAHYCNWLSRKEGLPIAYDEKIWTLLDGEGGPTSDTRQVRGYRLPTEAEWEFAARERGRKVRFGNGQNVACSDEINFDATSDRYPYGQAGINRNRSMPVGSFKPNTLGLFDMSGNAWEWVNDCAGDYPNEKRINPCIPGDEPRILRGGSMGGDAKSVRVCSRACFGRADHCGNSGFRIALTASSEK